MFALNIQQIGKYHQMLTLSTSTVFMSVVLLYCLGTGPTRMLIPSNQESLLWSTSLLPIRTRTMEPGWEEVMSGWMTASEYWLSNTFTKWTLKWICLSEWSLSTFSATECTWKSSLWVSGSPAQVVAHLMAEIKKMKNSSQSNDNFLSPSDCVHVCVHACVCACVCVFVCIPWRPQMAAVLTAIIFSLSFLDLLIMALASLWQGKTPMFS